MRCPWRAPEATQEPGDDEILIGLRQCTKPCRAVGNATTSSREPLRDSECHGFILRGGLRVVHSVDQILNSSRVRARACLSGRPYNQRE